MREKIKGILTITRRDEGALIIDRLTRRGIAVHYQCTAHGTAPTEMLDILGIGERDKDVVFSFGPESAVSSMVHDLRGTFPPLGRSKGLMIFMSLTGVSNLLSLMLQKENPELPGGMNMNNEQQNCLICISVNAGFADDVMHIARQAGAGGGTVIRGRLAGGDEKAEEVGVKMEEEKEIILILESESKRADIMNAVSAQFGFRSPAQGILHSMPVDYAIKL